VHFDDWALRLLLLSLTEWRPIKLKCRPRCEKVAAGCSVGVQRRKVWSPFRMVSRGSRQSIAHLYSSLALVSSLDDQVGRVTPADHDHRTSSANMPEHNLTCVP